MMSTVPNPLEQHVPEQIAPPLSLEARARSLDHACLAARIADEVRGQDTLVLDLTRITPIVDYFVVTTAGSSRQMRSIAEEIRMALKAAGSRSFGTEGETSTTWILQDYGDVCVHVFSKEGREMYDLEHLWADAPRIDWQNHPTGKSRLPR